MYRLVSLARMAHARERRFACFFTYGVAIWITVQALINIGVTTGVLPTKGLTLPFISYGGSSILVTCITVGVLFRVAYELSCETGLSLSNRYYR